VRENDNAKILVITPEKVAAFLRYLLRHERTRATMEKYGRDLNAFRHWLIKRDPAGENAKETALSGGDARAADLSGDELWKVCLAYKTHLTGCYAARSVNSKIAALNGFFAFVGAACRLKPLVIQQQTYMREEKELSRAEYERLLAAARSGRNESLLLLMQTICSTGIRVSESRFITVEAVTAGVAEITSKRKTRPVILPRKLQALLLKYAQKKGIQSGYIFRTKSGQPLDRRNIWAAMKKLCAAAGVAPSKVFPHNLRHLFARLFYVVDKDIMRLADLLGHSDVNTTRIYVKESGREHRRRLESLRLVTEY
jgi:site-specific recombinase XerD